MTRPKRMQPLRTVPAEPALPVVAPRSKQRSRRVEPEHASATPESGPFGVPIRWWVPCGCGGVLDLCQRCA